MLDWIIPTLAVVSLILVLTEVWVRLSLWKRKETHIYEQLAKTLGRMAGDVHEDEEVSAIKNRIEKLEKVNQDK